MVATPLHLPSHADIHEFSVLFTKSVKKKQKDWHDGYLKWHTFNFRAILYDDQRKQVANDFFPGKTIHSNSELEFSGALVQIGDQTETLQANLDPIYRTSTRTNDNSPVTRLTSAPTRSHASSSIPVTPGAPRSVQKRIYPDSHGMTSRPMPVTNVLHESRPRSGAETQETPVRAPKRRLIGMAKPKSLTQRQLVYPSPNMQASSGSKEPESSRPGWFAQQDQRAEQQDQRGPSSNNDAATVVSESRAKATKKRPTAAEKHKLPTRAKFKAVSSVTPASNDRFAESSGTATTSTARQESEVIDLDVEAELPKVEVPRPASRLDPTRVTVKRKPRMLLAAARHCSVSAELTEAPRERSDVPTASQRTASRLSECRGSERVTSPACRGSQPIPSPVEPNHNDLPDVFHAVDRFPEIPNTKSGDLAENAASAILQPSIEVVDRARSSSVSWSQSPPPTDEAEIAMNQSETTEPLVPETNAALSLSPLRQDILPMKMPADVDEDGFVAASIRARRSKPPRLPAHQTSSLTKRRRPVDDLIEEFRPVEPSIATQSSRSQPASSLAKGPTGQVQPPRSPLFVPDGSCGSQATDNDDNSPGINTQINRRIAQTIAKRSTVGRIKPGARRKVVSNKQQNSLNKKKAEQSKTVPIKRLSKQDSSSKENVNPAVSLFSKSPSVERSKLRTHVETKQHDVLAETLFPPTPVEVETREIDAMFEADEIPLPGPAKSGPHTVTSRESNKFADLRPPKPSTSRPPRKDRVSTLTRSASDVEPTDAAIDQLPIATQLNRRAPDFMTAKSFTLGRILPLDKPMPSLGISERELHGLDLSTQLSDTA